MVDLRGWGCTNLLFGKVFAKTYMKMKTELNLEGALATGAPFLGSDNDDPYLPTVTSVTCVPYQTSAKCKLAPV